MEKISKKSFLEKINGYSRQVYGAHYRPEITINYIASMCNRFSEMTLYAFNKRKAVKVNEYSVDFEYQENNQIHVSTLGLQDKNGKFNFFSIVNAENITFLVVEHEYMGFDLQTREDTIQKGYVVYAKAE